MADKKKSWTEQQREAIESEGVNLLLSASAGSGKTTVMIDRILHIIQKEKVPLENFLVVTFTKASALDMKQKLVRALTDAEPTDFTLEQMENVATADISNLHSFCARLISTYFYKLQIDPSCSVIEESEQVILKERAIKTLFEAKEKSDDVEFYGLYEMLQKKRNTNGLKDAIYKINDYANSILGGIDLLIKKIEQSHSLPIEKNECANLINRIVCNEIEDDIDLCENFKSRAESFDATKSVEHFDTIIDGLKTIKSTNSFEVNSKNLFSLSFARTPTIKEENLKFLLEETKVVKDKVKENIKSYKSNFISDDMQVLRNGMIKAKNDLICLLKLTAEFDEEYRKLKKEANVLDFNDLEKFALSILEDDDILQALHEKYKYVLVDEYQDINEVQEKIISKISGKNNRFQVGDIKQSIYRFRYCDPEIFLEKFNTYGKSDKSGKVIPLNENFRSDKNILKFVDKVFCGVMTERFGGIDYEKDSKFIPNENNSDDKKSTTLAFIDSGNASGEKIPASGVYSVKNHKQVQTSEDKICIAEAHYVASVISSLVGTEVGGKKLGYGDFAILTPNRNATSGKFTEILESYKIPISSDEKIDLAERPYIDEIVSFLKFVTNRDDDIVCFKVLKSRLFGFSDEELIAIRNIDKSVRFFDCVKKFDCVGDSNLKEKLRKFNETALCYERLSRLLGVHEFVQKVVDDFELDSILLASYGGETAYGELCKFVSSLPNTSVFDFVSGYEDYKNEIENDAGASAVKIMTIHRSKGMQFKVVILVGTSENINFKSTYGNLLISKKFGAGMTYFDFETRSKMRSLVQSAIGMLEKRKLAEEYQRLLYVALTRAESRLFVVCSGDGEKLSGKSEKHKKSFFDWFSPIIYECLNGKGGDDFVFCKYSLSDWLLEKDTKKPDLILFDEKAAGEYKPFEYKFSNSIDVPLKNSVTNLIRTSEIEEKIDDPFDFDDDIENLKNDEIIGNNSFAERGTAYHKVLENINLLSKDDFGSQIDEIVKDKLQESERSLIDKNIVLRTLSLDFFKNLKADDVILKEREFFAKIPAKMQNNCAENSDTFTLQGVIDLILIESDGIVVLDYKTGKMSDEKLEKYKFQLDLYGDVAQRALEKRVKKKLICFIDEQKIIEI